MSNRPDRPAPGHPITELLLQGPATLHLGPGRREEMIAPPLPHFLVRHELYDQLGQPLGSLSQAYVGPDRRVKPGDCGTGGDNGYSFGGGGQCRSGGF